MEMKRAHWHDKTACMPHKMQHTRQCSDTYSCKNITVLITVKSWTFTFMRHRDKYTWFITAIHPWSVRWHDFHLEKKIYTPLGIAVDYGNLNRFQCFLDSFFPLIKLQTDIVWLCSYGMKMCQDNHRITETYQISIWYTECRLSKKYIIAKTNTTNWV
jgi:hypothetical protein